jgi:ABC-type glycerol-3-phosphate transport system substrate-binding protein
MKMKNKTVSLVFAFLLTAGMVWAGGAKDGGGGVTTISLLPHTTFTSRAMERSTWFTGMLEKDLKVKFSFIEFPSQADQYQIFQNMLMSRQMADLIMIGDVNLAKQAAAAGLLVDLDKYKDKLPNLYNDPRLAGMLKYNRTTFGLNGQGLYVLSMMVGKSSTTNFVPNIRWDLYEKLGSPPVKTAEDIIPLLKRMMEINPVSESGHKTYGMAIYPEWDVLCAHWGMYFGAFYGGGDHTTLFELTGDSYTGNVISRVDDSSRYKRGIHWLFLANQAGVLDPDSVSETFATVQQKIADGRVFFSYFSWLTSGYNIKERVEASEPKGFMPILTDDMRPIIQPDSPIGGEGGRLVMVGASEPTKIDAALRYLNYLYSWDFVTIHNNGPEGLAWEKGSDGKGRITPRGFDILDNDPDVPELSNTKWGTLGQLLNADMYNADETNPVTGYPLSGFIEWPDYIRHSNAANNLWKRWNAANGEALNFYDLITKRGVSTKTPSTVYFIPPLPSDLESLQNQVGDVIKTDSWKAIYAKDEAEFQSIWKGVQEKTKTLGIDRLNDWYRSAWKAASDEAAKY